MRTTLDLDPELLAAAASGLPEGTPKTLLIEEALRRMIAGRPSTPSEPIDPRLARLVADGRLQRATAVGPPRRTETPIPLDRLLSDLARDREER